MLMINELCCDCGQKKKKKKQGNRGRQPLYLCFFYPRITKGNPNTIIYKRKCKKKKKSIFFYIQRPKFGTEGLSEFRLPARAMFETSGSCVPSIRLFVARNKPTDEQGNFSIKTQQTRKCRGKEYKKQKKKKNVN